MLFLAVLRLYSPLGKAPTITRSTHNIKPACITKSSHAYRVNTGSFHPSLLVYTLLFWLVKFCSRGCGKTNKYDSTTQNVYGKKHNFQYKTIESEHISLI